MNQESTFIGSNCIWWWAEGATLNILLVVIKRMIGVVDYNHGGVEI